MNKISKVLIIIASVSLLTACSSSIGNKKLSSLDDNSINYKFIEGQTTSNDVLAVLGEPNNKDIEVDDFNEKWIYTHTRNIPKASAYIPYASLLIAKGDVLKKQLVFMFDKNGILLKKVFSDNHSVIGLGLNS